MAYWSKRPTCAVREPKGHYGATHVPFLNGLRFEESTQEAVLREMKGEGRRLGDVHIRKAARGDLLAASTVTKYFLISELGRPGAFALRGRPSWASLARPQVRFR